MKKRLKPASSNMTDWQGFLEEFQKESDRAATIIGAAFLDEHLRGLIAKLLVDDKSETDDLLGTDEKFSAPLGQFTARIKAAYCLGLISQEERDDLKIIAKIRNQFAHRIHGLTFENELVSDLCKNLQIPDKVPLQFVLSSRQRFNLAVTMIGMGVHAKALSTTLDHRLKKSNLKVGGYVTVDFSSVHKGGKDA